jgi:predicted transcriptional regulator
MEIMAAIVAATQKPEKITRILVHVNLSYKVLRKYVKSMLSLRLIEMRKVEKKDDEKGEVFQATKKGLAFLKVYCDLLRIVYGEDFLQKDNNLAVVCIKSCKDAETTAEKC